MNSSTPYFKIGITLCFALVLVLSSSTVTVDQPTNTLNEIDGVVDSAVISSTSGDIYSGSGDWVIDQYTEYISENVAVDGDILIKDNGTLVLQDTTISLTVSGSLVNVSDGGYLESSIDSSLSADVAGYFNFSIYGNVSMTDTNIKGFDEITMKNNTLNATFTNCEFQNATGNIKVSSVHSAHFDTCYFHHINCSGYFIDGFNFIIENCKFGSFEGPGTVPSPHAQKGLIHSDVSFGYVKVLSNDFYAVDTYGTSKGDVIDIGTIIGNVTISDNRFVRCGDFLSTIIKVQDVEAVISRNRIISSTATRAIYLIAANNTIAERNLIWNHTGSAISLWLGNSTVRWNNILDNSGNGIDLDDADGALVHGNAIFSNNIGLKVSAETAAPTIYLNGFLDNAQHAVDYNNDDAITWDNGTIGNLWDNFTGTAETGNIWIGDSSFSPHENITDSYPSLMIGELPPSSGTWDTDIPNMFMGNDLTIDGNVDVTGPGGAILLFSNSLSCGASNTFTFGENSIFWIQESEVTTANPTDEMGDFHFNDIFYFGAVQSSISNIGHDFNQDDFTISARFVDIEYSTFSDIPGITISAHSDYEWRDHWTPIDLCSVQNNIFEDIKADSSNTNVFTLEWPSIDFINNTVEARDPDRTVTIEPYIPLDNSYNQSITIDSCNISNAILNVTVVSSEYTMVDITNCEFGQGGLFRAMETFGEQTPQVYSVNNSVLSGDFDIRGLNYLGTQYYLDVVFDNNIFSGDCLMFYIDSCSGDNNTFNNQLWIDDTLNCVISGSEANGNVYLRGPSYHVTFQDTFFESATIYVGSGGVNYTTFDNCSFDSISWNFYSGTYYFEITDSTFYSGFVADTGFPDGVHNVTIENSEFYMSGDEAIFIDDGDNATIIGNTIINASNGIRIRYGKNPIVAGNNIANISGTAINVDSSASTAWIANNQIFNATSNGISTGGLDNGSLIADNSIELVGGYGIRVQGYDVAGHSYFITVQNNIITNCSGDGMYLVDLHNASIYNNRITDSGDYGFKSDLSYSSIFWMNVLYDNQDGNFFGTGSFVFDNGTHGNFWGPSGPGGSEYCDSYSTGGNPWIADVPYEVTSGYYDNNALLLSMPQFLSYSNEIEDIWGVNFHLIALNCSAFPQQEMYIFDGGNMTLIGTYVEFQSDAATIQPIIVEDGCSLTLMNGAIFTANNTDTTYGFYLEIGSWLEIDNASIYRCGYGDGNAGLFVNSTGVSFNEVSIHDSPIGMELYQVSFELSTISFYDCETALLINDCTLCNVTDIYNENVDLGVNITSSSECTIQLVDFTMCTNYGVWISSGSPDNNIIDNKFVAISGTGLYIASSGTDVYLNAFIENGWHIDESGSVTNTYTNGTFGNFYYDYDGVDDDGDLIGDTPYSSAISDIVDNQPLMVFGALPTSTGWTVDRFTIALNTNFTMNGHVDVYEELYLEGTRLWMNSSETATYRTITVCDGGKIHITNATLRAINSSYRYKITANIGSEVYVVDTYLINQHWLLSRTLDLTLTNVTWIDVYDGVALLGGGTGDYVFENCTVNGAEHHGIFIDAFSNITIRDWFFYSVDDMAIRTEGTDVTIEDIFVYSCETGVYYDHTGGILTVRNSVFNDTNYCLTGNTAVTILVDNVNGYFIGTSGIRTYYVDNATIINTHIEMTGSGTSFELDSYTTHFELYNLYGFNGSNGVLIDDYSYGTIDLCEFYNFSMGIRLYGPVEVNITNSLLYGCGTGFEGYFDCSAYVIGNTFQYCDDAVDVHTLTDSYFMDLIIENCEYGITTSNTFNDVVIAGNTYLDTTYPIHISHSHNFIIENEIIASCSYAISLDDTHNVTIRNVDVTTASATGLHLKNYNNLTVIDVTLDGCDQGFYIGSIDTSGTGGGLYLNETVLTNCDVGLYLVEPYLTMRDCTMSSIGTTGIEYYDVYGTDIHIDIDTSNTLEGLPIYSFYNVSDITTSGFETYSFAVIESSNVTIVSAEFHNFDNMFIRYSDNVTLANSTVNTDLDLSGDDYYFIGNTFDDTIINFISNSQNFTFTLNAFKTSYYFDDSFRVTDLHFNASEYGNYWYNHDGTDSDHDGIGDDPFRLPGHVSNLYDYLPLMANPVSYTAYLTLHAPSDTALLSGLANVSVTVDVVVGFYYEGSVSIVTSITLNGTEVHSAADGSIEFDLDTSVYGDGLYILKVTTTVNSIDEFTDEIQVTLDNTGPNLVVSIEDETVTTDDNPYWTVDVEDDISDLLWIAAYLDGVLFDNDTEWGQTGTLSFSPEFTSEKSYELCLRSMDELGNIGEVNLTVYYDTSAPQLSSPADISYEVGTSGQTITWEVSDLTPQNYSITLDGSLWQDGDWEGDDIITNVSGLLVGDHTLVITVYDRAGYSSTDTVEVEVTDASTTTTTGTTDTTTTTTDGTTPPPDGEISPMMIALVFGGLGAGIVIVIIVLKMKKSDSA
ncbi:MAG: exported protein of unknown function [Candidatus Thorarchaeota archaeon]|nr:MAG: exported protein of unknown function [Candidatus Thorarchaeota archaeon]